MNDMRQRDGNFYHPMSLAEALNPCRFFQWRHNKHGPRIHQTKTLNEPLPFGRASPKLA